MNLPKFSFRKNSCISWLSEKPESKEIDAEIARLRARIEELEKQKRRFLKVRTEIYGDRITLKRYEKAFAPLLFEAASESRGGEFSRWMPWCHNDYAIAESESFIQKVMGNWQTETEFGFVIFDAKTDEFLGGVGLNQPNDQHKFYNLGYWIRVSKQNQGTASAATRLLAKAAFEDRPINRLEIIVAVENVPSQKTAEKAGAMREGVLRKRLIIGGEIHDAVMFSFVREDFQHQQND